MSRFGEDFIEELRARILLSDVIGKRVKLHRRGRQALGLCPFHNEKSPSFNVYDEDGHYHCFGCSQHGDAISFVMKTEGLSFPDAVEKLAREAGIALPQIRPEEAGRYQRRQDLHSVLAFAARYFQQHLNGSDGRAARAYLDHRMVGAKAVQQFRLGFAPDRRNGLREALIQEKIPESLAIEAGLLIKPEDRGECYDRFRGRLMFPILDRQGRVIAFGGRLLSEDKNKPKYLNSPETPLFHKSRELYGLSFAAMSAREKNRLIIVEGYMDVIALWEKGIEQAVAPLGTALTEEQLGLLWRYVAEPILCFDGDNAGEKAAARASERALPILKPGLSCKIAWMPKGEDPDSFVRGQGAGSFLNHLEKAEPLADFLWRSHRALWDLGTPERRAGFKKEMLSLTQKINDIEVKDSYRKDYLARLEGLFAVPLKGERKRLAKEEKGGGEAARLGVGNLRRRQYETLLLAAIHHPILLEKYGEQIAELDWPLGPLDKLKSSILELATLNPHLDSREMETHLFERGFGSTLEMMMRSNLASFAAQGISPEHAERGFVHVLELVRQNQAREQELSQAAQHLAEDMSPRTWAMFQAKSQLSLKGERNRRDIDDPSVPDYDGSTKPRKQNG